MKKTILFLFMFTELFYSQEIHLRTVPLAAGNQGDFYPSLSRGMGNLSIAFDDPISDPLINPAKTYKLNGLRFFFSPTRNTWSNEDGRAIFTTSGSAKYTGTAINSMPFGLFLKKENFFTGGIISYQSYSSERSIPGSWESSINTKSDIGNNVYLLGLAGMYFPELNLSVGGSISWAEFDAMDGVNLLYPGSSDIKQGGRSLNYKIGFVGELSKQSQMEFVIGRTTFKSSHKVTYGSLHFWYEDSWIGYRTELNKDESKGWVIHTKYNSSINDELKIGGIFTVNWKEHPKIPNYALANIPRDPGSSTAYNIGIGIVNSGERTTLGFEYIYEPMKSYTWAEAGTDINLPPAFKTVENYFDFYNHIFRGGLYTHTDITWLDYRLGIQLHFNKYNLKQNDNVLNTSRTLNENWLETTLCGGLTINISSFQIFYSLQVILGNGLVGTEVGGIGFPELSAEAVKSDFLIAPYGSLVVDDIPLVTQQISFVYNLK
jgi:hypothetical protein